ncbi:MAG: hypothetical protein IJ794_01450 [Lachnospiraceae bacterium]|nr:hypothetical protein [Lachnospiraceae bacterium]
MKEKRIPVLLLCDKEEEYAQAMTEFLRGHKELPWSVRTYTNTQKMLETERGNVIDLLVVAERTYDEEVSALRPRRTIVLIENGLDVREEFVNIDKYQEAQKVLQGFLEAYLEVAEAGCFQVAKIGNTQYIGLYSPVRRCMQTTFALTLSQMLAVNHKTLYLNFEHYSGISELAAQAGARDLADLLYFLMAEQDKFQIRLQTIAQHSGNLDYIPPMKSGQNLLAVSAEEWQQLLHRLAETGMYEYVILDLSESMQGLFDILRLCTMVFTLTKEDRVAQGKLAEYERILEGYSYEDVLRKTRKCQAPKVRKVPDSLDQYTKGEMADFMNGLIKELEGTKDNGLH